MYLSTILRSLSSRIMVPRACRFICCERLDIPWRRLAAEATILPEPVTLNRFLVPLLVFILGISAPLHGKGRIYRPGMPYRPGRDDEQPRPLSGRRRSG